MQDDKINLKDILDIPQDKFNTTDYFQLIKEDISKRKYKIIVLDDDPTGVQTVNDIFVLTDWSNKYIGEIFKSDDHLFYILTNSRSMSSEETIITHKEIARNIADVSNQTGKRFILISRSDSTLRGYYPLEIDTLRSTLEKLLKKNYTHQIIIPAFFEGGRYTYLDVHWVKEGKYLIPCSQTEFSDDPIFKYRNSNLKKWIEEKTGKRITAPEVRSITLEDIRNGGPAVVKNKLLKNQNRVFIVNAVNYRDLEIFTYGCILAEKEGIAPIFRTAASFVKTRGAIKDIGLLSHGKIYKTCNNFKKKKKGIIIVGSFVNRTTEQLNYIIKRSPVEIQPIELNVENLFSDRHFEIDKIVSNAKESLKLDGTPLIFTSRKIKKDKYDKTFISSSISKSLVDIAAKIISAYPASLDFIITKGGITSSDIATKAFKVKKALVLGQIYPGIPVLKVRYPGLLDDLPLIIFPGNVGNKETLFEIFKKLISR